MCLRQSYRNPPARDVHLRILQIHTRENGTVVRYDKTLSAERNSDAVKIGAVLILSHIGIVIARRRQFADLFELVLDDHRRQLRNIIAVASDQISGSETDPRDQSENQS